jgi:hypothetical protein
VNKGFLTVIVIAVIAAIAIIFFQTRRSELKNEPATDNKPVPAEDSSHAASPMQRGRTLALPVSVGEQEPAGTEKEEVTAQELEEFLDFLDDLGKAGEQVPTQTKGTDTISPEYLSIGMIIDPYTDIPGATYETHTIQPSGATIRVPTNLPEGYEAVAEASDTVPGIVVIVPSDGNYKTIQIVLRRNGVSEALPPEEGWELYQERNALLEALERFPRGSEERQNARKAWDEFREEHGSLKVYTSKSGSGYPVIVYGPDWEGGYRSIVNP